MSLLMSRLFHLPFGIDDLGEPGSRAFHICDADSEMEGFVVRKGQQLFAYRNQCPHTGAPLNWSEHVFLDSHEELIQCAMHGALFTIEKGYCLRGPCQGGSLQQLAIETRPDGRIFVEIPIISP